MKCAKIISVFICAVILLTSCDPFAGRRPIDYPFTIWTAEYPNLFFEFEVHQRAQSEPHIVFGQITQNGIETDLFVLFAPSGGTVAFYNVADENSKTEEPSVDYFLFGGDCDFGKDKLSVKITNNEKGFLDDSIQRLTFYRTDMSEEQIEGYLKAKEIDEDKESLVYEITSMQFNEEENESSPTQLNEEIEEENDFSSTQLSVIIYPEWLYLSENHHIPTKIFSPIDHDYNRAQTQQIFIGDAAQDFRGVWRNEMEYQYDKALNLMPEEFREIFIKQQSAWLEYEENDVFNYIGAERGYGYIREWNLISMNRIRERTLEIMKIIFLLDSEAVEFAYS